jgi:lipopolysaccharide export system permease protein
VFFGSTLRTIEARNRLLYRNILLYPTGGPAGKVTAGHRLGKILGRYILREVITAWIVVMGVLLVILLADQVAAVLERAAASQFPQGVVLELIYLGMLQYLSILVPFGLLLGIVLALGRLYHDTELAAALACGVRPVRLYGGVIGLGVVLAAGLAALTLRVGPGATAQALTIRNAAVRAGQFAPLQAGTFRAFGGGSAVVYAEKVDPDGTLENVFVERNQGPVVEVAVARRALHTVAADGTSQTIELLDGERLEGIPGSAQFRSMDFAEHTIPVPVPPVNAVITDLDAQPTAALLSSRDPRRLAQLQWRISMPLMCIVLTVLAVPLAHLRPRQGRYARIWLAVVVYLVYSNLISLGQAWIAHGAISAALGLWWTHAAVVLLALAVIFGPQVTQRLRYRMARA